MQPLRKCVAFKAARNCAWFLTRKGNQDGAYFQFAVGAKQSKDAG